ncbi:ALOX15B [Branchiostoma lanceolatum]|uniref:ALOX15B protein n=1 Tax=Branchiostoma lanceolatum TaxID=7740 RepID=A0A8J9ZU82_BRALA|nr:ALOX15B [Branchiostoma lanceolatum]
MGNKSSSTDPTCHIKTEKAAGGPIFVVFEDISGNRTEATKLSLWKNSVTPSDIQLRERVTEMEIWSEGKGHTYVDTVKISSLSDVEVYTFPVQRLLKPGAGNRLFVPPYDCCLPQTDPHPAQRRRELSQKKKDFQMTTLADGCPVQVVAGSPREAMWTQEYKKAYFNIRDRCKSDELLLRMTRRGQVKKLGNFPDLYKLGFKVPQGMENWWFDKVFGQQRLQGLVPNLIKLCKEIPASFNVTEEMVKAVLKDVSLKQALQDKRLYLTDLTMLKGVKCIDGNVLCAPMALFFVDDEGDLMPIAIQLFSNGPEKFSHNVFLPTDPPYTWLLVKMWYNLAEASWHLACGNFGFSRLAMESVALCAHRTLSVSHPVFRLLAPHFNQLIPANRETLRIIDQGQWMDETTRIGRVGFIDILQRGWKSHWRMNVEGNLPRDLENREVDDKTALRNYHYRDDALPIWHAIEKYARTVLKAYYDTPNKVTEDHELRAWRVEMTKAVAEGGAGIQGVPGEGEFRTIDDVIATVTSVIFTCTVSHAVSLQMYSQCAFPPNYPLNLVGSPITDKKPLTIEDVLKYLPTKEETLRVMSVTRFLSCKGNLKNTLGDLDNTFLFTPAGKAAVKRFREELATISASNKKKDRNPPYSFLDPDVIQTSCCF